MGTPINSIDQASDKSELAKLPNPFMHHMTLSTGLLKVIVSALNFKLTHMRPPADNLDISELQKAISLLEPQIKS